MTRGAMILFLSLLGATPACRPDAPATDAPTGATEGDPGPSSRPSGLNSAGATTPPEPSPGGRVVETAPPRPRSVTPRPRPAVGWWMPRFERMKRQVTTMGAVELLFVGDSITEDWAFTGREVWEAHFAHRAVNLGVAGDRTQNILWRLEEGQLACPEARWAVVLAGTNNLSDRDSDADVAEGVATLVHHVLDHCPTIRVLVLGIFPREPPAYQARIRRINDQLARLDNGGTIRYLDLGPRLAGPDGRPLRELFPDGLHLSARAYRIWADALLPILDGNAD
jgi:lysophospholipase L1-like esterase